MKSICLRVGIGNQNWMDHSHHSGKARNWWEHWQVYVTDVEFTRDGNVLVYIEKCRDWFRTYHYVVLAFSWLPQLSFAHKAPWALFRLEKVAGEADTSTWPGQLYVWVENLKQTWENCRWDPRKLCRNFDDRLGRAFACNDHRGIRLDEVIIQIMLWYVTFDTFASQKLVVEEIRVILCRSFHTVSIHTGNSSIAWC